MNKTYRLVWNELTGAWIAVAEHVKARGKRSSGVVLAAAVLSAPVFAQTSGAPPAPTALPTGGQVVAGQAGIVQSGAAMTINQVSQRAAIDWQTFNIGSQASVHFQQPAGGVALNRVADPNPSQIFGRLTATGQVFLSNPSGIYFSPSASVNVGALVATTHTISLDDFMAGKMRFERNGATGEVINAGELQAALGGYIALLAPEVRNEGVIVASMGTVALAAGEAFELQFDSNNTLASLRVDPATVNALVENKSAVLAPGGLVILSARAVDTLQGSVVNSGDISASSLVSKGGRILLEGDDITLASGSSLDATGATGGGEVLVGGDWQGSGDMHQATRVTMEKGASINVSATDNGDGGKVVLWSDVSDRDSVTEAHGSILAKGGANGGDGGRIETSGHVIDVSGVTGSAAASQGTAGEWLFDPTNISIGSGGSVAGSTNNGTSLSASSINSLLDGGTSVTVTTHSGGGDLGNIFVDAAVTKSSGNADVTLTLRAANVIAVNQDITHAGGSGKLNLVFDADNNTNASTAASSPVRDGAGIVILEANLSTGGGSLTVGGTTANGFTGGDLYVGGGSNPISITTAGGAVDVEGQLIIANSSSSGLTINTGGGAINLRGAIDSGNQYAAVGGTWTWEQALADADNVSNSYLTTVTSSLENALAIRAANYSAAWLGGRRLAGTNLWQWVADPAFHATNNPLTFFYQASSSQTQLSAGNSGYGGTTATGYYANWSSWTNGSTSPSEPNNWNGSAPGTFSGDNESALQFTGTQGQWNDLPYNGYQLNQYVRETNLAPSSLTLNAGGGAVNINGAIGANKALASLNVSASATTINGAALITTGAQTYNNTLTVTSTGHLEIASSSLTVSNAGQDLSFTAEGGDLTIRAPLSVAGGSNSDVTLKSTRHISLREGANITGSAPADLLFWADSDNSGDGLIAITATNIDTKGGSLQFGHDETATINGQSVRVGGDVYFNGTSAQTLSTGGGDIDIYGETIVSNTSGLNINSGDGNITLHGLLNSGNQYVGVRYDSATWLQAQDQANNVSESYLATITSRLENSIAALAVSYNTAWLGARRNSSGVWRWEEGPEAGQTLTYTNWATGEPNNCCNETNALDYKGENAMQFTGANGNWNDLFDNGARGSSDLLNYYVRETNLAESPVTINAGAGSITINGGVGGSKALASLNVTAASTTINGNVLKTTGEQRYNNALTVNASGDLNVAATALTITNTDQSLLFKASGSIVQAAGIDVTTNGGNAIYWADSDGTGGGTIALTGGASVQTSGGGIWMGGGSGTTSWTPRQGGAAITVGDGAASGGQYGVNIEDSSLDAGPGNVWLSGASTWTAGNYGVGTRVYADGNGKSATISGYNIDLTGGGSAGSVNTFGHWGVAILAYNSAATSLDASGMLNVTGNAGGSNTTGGSNHGVILQRASLSSVGNLALAGNGGGKAGGNVYNNGIHVEGSTLHSGAGALTLSGTQGFNGSSYGLAFYGTNVLGHATTQSGNMTLRGDTLAVSGTSVLSTGALTVEPLKTSFTNGFTFDSGWTLGSGLTGLTLGKSGNTGDVTIASATTVAGPIAVHAGDIDVNQSLTTTAGGALGDVLLKASGDIALAAGQSITTAGGDVILWADSDASSTGSINLLSGSAIRSGGGHIWMGGGGVSGTLWNGLTVGNGYAMAGTALSINENSQNYNFKNGITLFKAAIDSAGGDIALYGKSENQSGATGGYMGIYQEQSTISSGDGDISMSAISIGSNNDGSWHYGLLMGTLANATTASIVSTGGAVTINGETSFSENTFGSGVGLYSFDNADSTVKIQSTSGAISVNGRLNSTGFDGQYGGIYLYGSGSEMIVSQSGSISLEGMSANANVAGINVHPGNSSSRIGFDGTSAYTGDITLESNTRINFEGAIVARGLNLLGSGVAYTLTNASNDVDVLAVDAGSVTYVDSDALAIGTVGSTQGVSATGAVRIETLTGNLSITENIVTTATRADAVILNAGKNAAGGTASGGNILVTSGKTVQVGDGGTATLYTGSIADSINLTTMSGLGSGSGRFRYNADETTNFAAGSWTNLGSGLYAIYREQPTANISTMTLSMTYGDALPDLTATGAVNGDGASYDITGAAYSTTNQLKASSTPYIINSTLLGLGYNVTGESSGTLTVDAKALAVTWGGVNKTYDGNTTTTVTLSDDRIVGDTLTINHSAAFADKNAGVGKTVNVTGVSLSGTDAGNYTLASSATTTADIARLGSVAWIGGASGNWFDPANWAGGAVPDLSNVANVIIPANVVVSFDTTGAVSPADTGPVNIDRLGSEGGLAQANGILNIGSGGMTLDSFTQNGGTLDSQGDINLNRFGQTGGSTTTSGNFTVSREFSQGSNGSVMVGGNASITDTSGGVTIGNLDVSGNLDLTSRDGEITQANGTTITVAGISTVDAGSEAIRLDGANNDFAGPFNATGNDITVVDGQGGLVLGNIEADGDLAATSSDGDLTQADGSTITVAGTATVDAGRDDIVLSGAGNDFSGPVNARGWNIALVDGLGGLMLGQITAGGNFDATSHGGDITQAVGMMIAVGGATTVDAGTDDILLASAGNDFSGPFNGRGHDIAVADGRQGLVLGDIIAGGNLNATSTGGDITQNAASSIVVNGAAVLDAGNYLILLNGSGNRFNGGITRRDASTSGTGALAIPPAAPSLALPTPDTAPPPVDVGGVGDTGLGSAGLSGGADGIADVPSVSAASGELAANTPARGGAETVVELVKAPTVQEAGLISVGVPKEIVSSGFSFALPEPLTKNMDRNASISVTLENGGPLPSWLSFVPERLSFNASVVPPNALPLRILVMIDGRSSMVLITEVGTE